MTKEPSAFKIAVGSIFTEFHRLPTSNARWPTDAYYMKVHKARHRLSRPSWPPPLTAFGARQSLTPRCSSTSSIWMYKRCQPAGDVTSSCDGTVGYPAIIRVPLEL